MGGWDVFIHDPKTAWSENEPLTNSHHEHFFMESGTKVQIKIGMSTYSTLNTSGDPCGSHVHVMTRARMVRFATSFFTSSGTLGSDKILVPMTARTKT